MVKSLSLAQALKYKNKVVSLLNTTVSDIIRYNTYSAKNKPDVDVLALERQHDIIMHHLVIVKSLIHEASSSVRDKIFLLSELKTWLGSLRSIDTRHGFVKREYTDEFDLSNEWIATIKKGDLDKRIKVINKNIDNLQDELDSFNAITKVRIEIPTELED